ncbi:MAG: hypothetical protein GXP38_03495 [Chloroflexi bacterium]|nr:hypothetical protein [Chloroflexota bacterium]
MPTLPEFLTLIQPFAQQSAVGLSLFLIVIVLVVSDWRLAVGAYALLKVLGGILLTRLLPPEWALLQWVSGGLVGIMWFLSARRVDTIRRRQLGIPWWKPEWRLNTATLMRLALLLLLLTVAYTQRPLIPFPKLPADLARLATFLTLASLLGLGFGDRPLRWGLSLSLWILAASFVILALEVDVATVGLLASLDILLGFAISYLIVVDGARFWPHPEDV